MGYVNCRECVHNKNGWCTKLKYQHKNSVPNCIHFINPPPTIEPIDKAPWEEQPDQAPIPESKSIAERLDTIESTQFLILESLDKLIKILK